MLKTSEMYLVASQDACAPDAYEYFEKELKQKGIPSVSDFRAIGKKYEEDDGFYTQYHLAPYVLTIAADHPWYSVYLDNKTAV